MENYSDVFNNINMNSLYNIIAKELTDSAFVAEKDISDNIILRRRTTGTEGKKILFCSVVEKNGVIINKVDNNKAWYDIIGNISSKYLCDREVYANNESVGIIRGKYDDDKLKENYIELWDANSVKIGDICNINYCLSCKDDLLYGTALLYYIPYKLAVSLEKSSLESVKEIYFTLSSDEASLTALVTKLNPDYIFVIHYAEANEKFKVSQGCGIVYKDGCAVTNKFIRSEMLKYAEENSISYQIYIGRSTTLTEKLGITGRGAHVGGIYIPVNHINSTNPVASETDVLSCCKLIQLLADL